jgi:heme oxygenase (biliverdin-IX-beta and delta-forming)
MSYPSRRQILRGETARAHAALEEVVGRIDSLPSYVRYLRGMHAFRAPIEAALAAVAWPPMLGAWRPTCIAPALAADLADLEAQPLPQREPVSDLDSAGLLGVLYVLEGSSLGARLIARDARRLGLSDAHGARHLGVQIQALGTWGALLALLEIPLEDGGPINVASAVAAANAAFDAARLAVLSADKKPTSDQCSPPLAST